MEAHQTVTVEDIHRALRRTAGFYGVYVPEFTYDGLRIDAAIVDVRNRWVKGFEIKVSRKDFLHDEKWQKYTMFTSSLSIACPEHLIGKEEVPDPFGLVYIKSMGDVHWEKRPKRFQQQGSLAWLYQYVSVIERELPRLVAEVDRLKGIIPIGG